jgi:exopolysaccharide biosynthesis polyprenyl glycosylphosphotransferase
MLVDAGAGRAELRAPGVQVVGNTVAAAAPLTVAAAPASQRSTRWLRYYRDSLLVADAFIGAAAAAVMLVLHPGDLRTTSPYTIVAVALALVWPLTLGASGAYCAKLFGTGSEEFRRAARSGIVLLAAVSIVSYSAQLAIARSYVVFTIPGMTLATLLSRFVARRWLQRARRHGRCVKRVVVVGRDAAVTDLVRRLQLDRFAGMEIVAACVPSPGAVRQLPATGVPVAGDLESVVDVVRAHNADAVAVTSASETAALYLRKLSWQLEGSGIELLVSPGLVEIAGPRLHVRPFVGLPLLSIEEPVFSGWKRMLKGALDRAGAGLILLLLAPVLAVIALAVRVTSPGPALYRQQRVGAHGQVFTMFKFRSMVDGADARVHELLARNEGHGLLFKMRDDPRVTSVGRWLRRFSLDELPQLFNVLSGSMSLVGPRPPLPHEVERYDSSIRRRLLVKPGLTGLWQISGRSDLAWEESVRLDLRYVENWSLALDLLILWKTAAAVVRSRGAY